MEERRKQEEQNMTFGRGDEQEEKVQKPIRREKKIGRNAPCPCGSGLKYKKCCGR